MNGTNPLLIAFFCYFLACLLLFMVFSASPWHQPAKLLPNPWILALIIWCWYFVARLLCYGPSPLPSCRHPFPNPIRIFGNLINLYSEPESKCRSRTRTDILGTLWPRAGSSGAQKKFDAQKSVFAFDLEVSILLLHAVPPPPPLHARAYRLAWPSQVDPPTRVARYLAWTHYKTVLDTQSLQEQCVLPNRICAVKQNSHFHNYGEISPPPPQLSNDTQQIPQSKPAAPTSTTAHGFLEKLIPRAVGMHMHIIHGCCLAWSACHSLNWFTSSHTK